MGMACLVAASVASAQGHCALRDPKRSVFQGFPEADGYRAIVRDVDPTQRTRIDADLPFRVHFNEIGKHTLYVALRGQRPIGIVHARSEESRWGLVEIAWNFGLDLRVRSFRFQRVRSPHAEALGKSAFAEKLAGRDLEGLRALLTCKGDLAEAARPVPQRSHDLALTVLRSSLKTIIVTRSVWKGQLQGLRDLELGLDVFGDGRATRHLVHEKEPLDRARQVKRVWAVVVLDGRGRRLGVAAETEWVLGKEHLDLRWAVGDDGRILGVTCRPQWPDRATEQLFKDFEGRNTEVARAVAQVLALIQGKR